MKTCKIKDCDNNYTMEAATIDFSYLKKGFVFTHISNCYKCKKVIKKMQMLHTEAGLTRLIAQFHITVTLRCTANLQQRKDQ